MRLIILAAGRGTRLSPLTDTRPKCLAELGGRTLLDWQLEAAAMAGVNDVVVVGGYMAERLENDRYTLTLNPEFESTNMVSTLFCAEPSFGDEFVMSYGDIVYGPDVLRALLADQSPVGVVVDRNWRSYWETRFEDPIEDAESLRVGADGLLRSIGQQERDIDRIEAQYIGLVAFRGRGVDALKESYALAGDQDARGESPFQGVRPLAGLYMTDLLQGMIDLGHPLATVSINGGWVEIDSIRDLQIAELLIAEGRLDPVHL